MKQQTSKTSARTNRRHLRWLNNDTEQRKCASFACSLTISEWPPLCSYIFLHVFSYFPSRFLLSVFIFVDSVHWTIKRASTPFAIAFYFRISLFLLTFIVLSVCLSNWPLIILLLTLWKRRKTVLICVRVCERVQCFDFIFSKNFLIFTCSSDFFDRTRRR